MDPEARGASVPYGPLKGTCSYILNFELSQFIHPAIFYSEKSKKLFSYFPCERVKFFHVVKGLSFFRVVTPLTFPCTAKIQICPHIEEFSLSTYCQLQFSTYRCPPHFSPPPSEEEGRSAAAGAGAASAESARGVTLLLKYALSSPSFLSSQAPS